MDVYDPVSNTLFPTDKERIAAWFLDTRLRRTDVLHLPGVFPGQEQVGQAGEGAWRRERGRGGRFAALSGLTSLPFPRPERLGKGETWRVAVKVIDPRGNEGLRVLTMRTRY